MKAIIALVLIAICLFAYDEDDEEFFSLGMLPEGYMFICINGEKWLQHEVPGNVILQKLFYEDEKTGEILPVKCN